jgi:hypothetical protein
LEPALTQAHYACRQDRPYLAAALLRRKIGGVIEGGHVGLGMWWHAVQLHVC